MRLFLILIVDGRVPIAFLAYDWTLNDARQ
jgi:hypothetical protein